MEFFDNTSKIIDDGLIPFSVFIDLSKAFDTLDHNILLKILHYCGIQDTCINWFLNHITNRTQYTKFKDSLSIHLTIKTGVPQGSVLGPLLFLIYINYLPQASRALHAIPFADDTRFQGTMRTFYTFAPNVKTIKEYKVIELTWSYQK